MVLLPFFNILCSEGKSIHYKPLSFRFLETFQLVCFFTIFKDRDSRASMVILTQYWTTITIFFFPFISKTVLLAPACNQLLSKPSNLRIVWFNSLMGDSGEDEDNRRHYPWLFPLQAEQKPPLAHPGTHPPWWFTSEVPPVNQHSSYSGKTQM